MLSNKIFYKIILTTLISIFGIGIFAYKNPEKASAQVAGFDPIAAFAECIGPALAEYMLAILDAQAAGLIPSNIKLLSPAFNMTSGTFNPIVGAMNGAVPGIFNHPNLVGIAGNIYDTSGGNSMGNYWTNQNINGLFGNIPIYITESGNTENSGLTNRQTADNIAALLRNNPNIKNISLFVPTGSNPAYPHHTWSEDEINYLCSITNGCEKIGINYGTYFGGNDYNDVNRYNMNSGLQIADRGSIPSIIEAVRRSNGDVIVRIGVGSNSGGFDNPQEYIKFLKELGDSLPPGASIFAIAGPNEPDLEGWLTPECMDLLPINPAEMLCGGQIDEKPVSYRGEVVGHNGEIPWSINSNLRQQKDLVGGTVEGQLASTLEAEFTIKVPQNTFRHNDFKVVSDQMVGSLDPDDPNNLYFDDRLFIDEDGAGPIAPYMSPLKANIPLFNSALPGVKIPSSYSIGANETFQFAESNETPEEYLERVLKKTPEPGDGRKPEFGLLTEMPAMVFRACIQRSACNPDVEECLKADGSGELCGSGDNTEDCKPFGQTFNLTGRIGHREPTELHSISRSFELQKRQLVDRPGEPINFGQVVTQEDLSRSNYVFKDPDLNELADGMKYIQQISKNRNTNYKTSTGNEVKVANSNNGSLIKPAVANAQGESMAQPQGSLGVSVIELGGNRIQIDYEDRKSVV